LEISKSLGIHGACLGPWNRQAGIETEEASKNVPLSTSGRGEMTRLEKEIRELKGTLKKSELTHV
jgi:hypothetical protein